MRENLQLEAIWSNNEVVEVSASPGVEDQSAAVVAKKVDGWVQVTDPLPLAEEKDEDVHSRLADITEQRKYLVELVLTERRWAEIG